MRRTLLLIGFLAHTTLGSVCFAHIAYAKLDADGLPPPLEGPMSLRNAVTCPFAKQTQVAKIHPEQQSGGCPDGRCFQIHAPDASSIGGVGVQADPGKGIPVAFCMHAASSIASIVSLALIIDDPPIPPGIGGVVLRL